MKMADTLGQTVPPDTQHAVSVSLPTWRDNVGYEESEERVMKAMINGYPRFFVHLTIQELEREVVARYASADQRTILFPSRATAFMCQQFFLSKVPSLRPSDVKILVLQPVSYETVTGCNTTTTSDQVMCGLYCVLYPRDHAAISKQVWQHSGEGISSRRGEFCLRALRAGHLHEHASSPKSKQFPKGPRRYQRGGSVGEIPQAGPAQAKEDESPTAYSQFIEERFGRNLSSELGRKAKVAVRRRIAGTLLSNPDLNEALPDIEQSPTQRVKDLSEDDVYLFPCGMSAIFNAHRTLLARREQRKSICFGFPYIDTLKILEKWGPGCLFYGNGVDEDLDDLEKRLENGERYLALFTEFPSNPLLRSPNLQRIRQLAHKYDFMIVVDESIGNLINVNVLTSADVVVSSLTKVFSGDSNVMGGSATLNPESKYYQELKRAYEAEYEDNYWIEDAVFLERNSRDFISRIERINVTTESVVALLQASPLIRRVYYPTIVPSRNHYDACRNPGGGYGGLFSVTFHEYEHAIAFFDTLEVLKGPSLGTNFTLSCPFVIIAHYNELDWAAGFGVDRDLVRVSVGLEETEDLINRFKQALAAVARVAKLRSG